jgi:hypothetical protein
MYTLLPSAVDSNYCFACHSLVIIPIRSPRRILGSPGGVGGTPPSRSSLLALDPSSLPECRVMPRRACHAPVSGLACTARPVRQVREPMLPARGNLAVPRPSAPGSSAHADRVARRASWPPARRTAARPPAPRRRPAPRSASRRTAARAGSLADVARGHGHHTRPRSTGPAAQT